MTGLKTDVLKAIVVSKFGQMGPEAVACYPDIFKELTLTDISIKAVSILAGEDGTLPDPENLSVLPMPKLKMTSVIFMFEIPNPEARGGVVLAALSVLFNHKYTSVIYKMMDDLVRLITPMEKLKGPMKKSEDITDSLAQLYKQIEEFLNISQDDEVTRYQITAQAQKTYKFKYSFKIIVIGDGRVGKTTLLLHFVDKAFRELYIPTIGIQVSLKNFDFEETTLVKYNLWDIAGQDLFKQVRSNFYIGSQAVLICFDVTNSGSFKNVENWYKDMKISIDKKIPVFLVGNKIDLPRVVSKVNAKEMAKKLNGFYVETSAKTGENVEKVFEDLARILIKKDDNVAEWLLKD